MIVKRRWNFGIGTIFSLIVVYFIFLYSRDKEWTLLAFMSKWYLIIAGSLIALSIAVVLLIILFAFLAFVFAMLKLRKFEKRHGWRKNKEYVDAEYKVEK